MVIWFLGDLSLGHNQHTTYHIPYTLQNVYQTPHSELL